MSSLLERLRIRLPIIQAPMAAISTPEMAAAVSNAGGLGSIGIGNLDAAAARDMIAAVRTRTDRPFNVNVFCHQPAVRNTAVEAGWSRRLAPLFTKYHEEPPIELREIYTSFVADDETTAMLIEERPPVVSFHFGLPSQSVLRALHEKGVYLIATATSVAEADAIRAAGVDAIVAQGYEAGGHRGTFDAAAHDERLSTATLTRRLVQGSPLPVIAAGGIMDGAGIASVLALGANAAQLGTAFVLCPESSADAGYRQALSQGSSVRTTMTSAISGRPARSLVNRFTALGETVDPEEIPAYPVAYDAGKSLHAAAKKTGEFGYGAQWAGEAAALSRSVPAGDLVALLQRELDETLATTINKSSRTHA
ncbi:MAG TPA: nitronate monooxygenase [Lacipirellulaceae bacterium]|nr:nitronate monooxygenase [Lacipirellulaceae bacterium]